MNTPKHIKDKIRGTFGIETDDDSCDNQIEVMTPIQKLEAVCQWELGDKGWARQVLTWGQSCGIKISDEE